MIDTIGPGNRPVRSGVPAFDTAQVNPAFIGIGSPLMIDVDTTGLAEIVFRRSGSPGVEAQIV